MASRVLSPPSAVVEATVAALSAGPLDEGSLRSRLRKEGIELGPEPLRRLYETLDRERFVVLGDGRLADVLALAEGVVLTHELNAGEVFTGRVDLEPDLAVLAALHLSGLTLSSSSGPLDYRHDDKRHCDVLVGPEGWLGRHAVDGEVLAVTIEDGHTAISTGPATTAAVGEGTDASVAALRTAYDLLRRSEDGADAVRLVDLWLEARAADRDALARTPLPLGALLATAGFEAYADHVAPTGYDWATWEVEQVFALVAERWGLDEDGEGAFIAIARAFHTNVYDHRLDDADRATLGQLLSTEAVAPAFVGETLGQEADTEGLVAAFAVAAGDAARGSDRAGPLWVQAICAERAGRTLDAEALVTSALGADEGYPPAVRDAAWYAADRGDVRQAASLLRRNGDEADKDLLEMYDLMGRTKATSAGRNDPCPCGSGKKFKWCHLGRETVPLPQRAPFLHQKGVSYLERSHIEDMLQLAMALTADDSDREALSEVLQAVLVSDLALFEDHVWDDFVRDRGMLLPADELALAQQWQQSQRGVYEVRSVRPDEGITFVDVASGETTTVTEGGAARFLHVGDRISAHILPAGDRHHRLLGAFEVAAGRDGDDLLALLGTHPSGAAVASWVGMAARRHAPAHEG